MPERERVTERERESGQMFGDFDRSLCPGEREGKRETLNPFNRPAGRKQEKEREKERETARARDGGVDSFRALQCVAWPIHPE